MLVRADLGQRTAIALCGRGRRRLVDAQRRHLRALLSVSTGGGRGEARRGGREQRAGGVLTPSFCDMLAPRSCSLAYREALSGFVVECSRAAGSLKESVGRAQAEQQMRESERARGRGRGSNTRQKRSERHPQSAEADVQKQEQEAEDGGEVWMRVV